MRWSGTRDAQAPTGDGGGSGGTAATTQTSVTTDVGSSSNGSSGNAASTGSGGAPVCGDGTLQAPEECDDGPDNGPGQACNPDCHLNVCGDGDVSPTEACDDGPDNALELDACAPDCSRIIVKKLIRISESYSTANFGADPVAHADALCNFTEKALFVNKLVRRATTVPNQVVDPIDWVLSPYTYYYNDQNQPVWLTDEVALLGVREGAFTALENYIKFTDLVFVSGLHGDWTATNETCNSWVSTTAAISAAAGLAGAITTDFLEDEPVDAPCSTTLNVYCVEQ